MRWIVVCAALLLLVSARVARAQEQGYYVADAYGGRVTYVPNGDPNAAQNVDEWQVWLFEKDSPKRWGSEWSILSGPSAAAVMDKLHAAQKFEQVSCKFSKQPYPARRGTYTNPLGPIAITKRGTTPGTEKQARKQIDNLVDQIVATWELVGEVTLNEEFVDDLRDAHQRVGELQKRLNHGYGYLSEMEVNRALDAVMKDMDRVRRASGRGNAILAK